MSTSFSSLESLADYLTPQLLQKILSPITDINVNDDNFLEIINDFRIVNVIKLLCNNQYQMPTTYLPVDWHQFFVITRDYTNDVYWKDLEYAKINVSYEWAYNVVLSNIPTMSIDMNVFMIFQKIYGYIPLNWNFKYITRFASEFWDVIDDLGSMRRSNLIKFYESWLENFKAESKVIPSYVFKDGIDSQYSYQLYTLGHVVPQLDQIITTRTGRVLIPMIPKGLMYENSMNQGAINLMYNLNNIKMINYNPDVIPQRFKKAILDDTTSRV